MVNVKQDQIQFTNIMEFFMLDQLKYEYSFNSVLKDTVNDYRKRVKELISE